MNDNDDETDYTRMYENYYEHDEKQEKQVTWNNLLICYWIGKCEVVGLRVGFIWLLCRCRDMCLYIYACMVGGMVIK